MYLKVSSAKGRPFCLGLNVLIETLYFLWTPHLTLFTLAWFYGLLVLYIPLRYCYTLAQRSWWGGGILESPYPSACPSVCRRHGFRSVTQVCFGIAIWNFICVLLVAMGRSLSIFSDVTFKMAIWRPSWIFRFPDSNFCLALNFKSKLLQHISCMYW